MASPTHAGKPPLRLVWRKSDPPPPPTGREWRADYTAGGLLAEWRRFPAGVKRLFRDDLITFLHVAGVFADPPK